MALLVLAVLALLFVLIPYINRYSVVRYSQQEKKNMPWLIHLSLPNDKAFNCYFL